MNEVREYSNTTMKLVARRLRRAIRHMSPLLSKETRFDALIAQIQQQGLRPIDFAGDSGEAALIVIAQAIAPPRAVDTETTGLVPNTLVIDSLSREYKTASKKDQLFTLYGGRRRPRRVTPRSTLSPVWQRVLQHALCLPSE